MGDMAGHQYSGTHRSAIARAKRILTGAGMRWSRTTGRYSPFGGTQKTTHGVRVTRIGCSACIALHVYDGGDVLWGREARREIHARALEILREGGLPFDDRGWLECAE